MRIKGSESDRIRTFTVLRRFAGRRFLALLAVCLGITVVSFCISHLVPADPVTANLGLLAINDERIVAAYEKRWGLDKPLLVQYFVYLGNLLHGDLGESQQTHRPVLSDLTRAIPATIELGIVAMSFALVVGICTGVVAALRKDGWADQTVRLLSLTSLSVPVFWLGLTLLYFASFKLGAFPGSGRLDPANSPPARVTGLFTVDAIIDGNWSLFVDALHHLVLPALVLAAPNIGFLSRFVRSTVLDVVDSEFITAARSRGISGIPLIRRHILRPALTPIITLFGLLFATVMTGAVLVENVFSWPGLGQYAFRSAITLDLQAVMGVSLFVAVTYVAINFIVDVLYRWIDPRISFE